MNFSEKFARVNFQISRRNMKEIVKMVLLFTIVSLIVDAMGFVFVSEFTTGWFRDAFLDIHLRLAIVTVASCAATLIFLWITACYRHFANRD